MVVTSFVVGGGGGVDWALLLEPASSEPTEYAIQWNPSIAATIGNEVLAIIEGWPYLRYFPLYMAMQLGPR